MTFRLTAGRSAAELHPNKNGAARRIRTAIAGFGDQSPAVGRVRHEKVARGFPDLTTCGNRALRPVDVPRHTSPAALCRGHLSRNRRDNGSAACGFLRATFGRVNAAGHGPLSYAATASPIRAHRRARPLPDRKGLRITRRNGGPRAVSPEGHRNTRARGAAHGLCGHIPQNGEALSRLEERSLFQRFGYIGCGCRNRTGPLRVMSPT